MGSDTFYLVVPVAVSPSDLGVLALLFYVVVDHLLAFHTCSAFSDFNNDDDSYDDNDIFKYCDNNFSQTILLHTQQIMYTQNMYTQWPLLLLVIITIVTTCPYVIVHMRYGVWCVVHRCPCLPEKRC